MTPSVALSNFVLDRNKVEPTFTCSPQDLLNQIYLNWDKRTPGAGRSDLSEVVLVELPVEFLPHNFISRWIPIKHAHSFETKLEYRRAHEDPYLETTALGTPLLLKKAFVVCYHKDVLINSNEALSSTAEWEVVAVIASPWDAEPMMPLTMARNFLQKPGGTFAPYSATQLAESIYFWSGFVKSRA
jgi:Protein of unknown function (DUF3228)